MTINYKQAREKYDYPRAHIRCKKNDCIRPEYFYVRPLENIEGQDSYIIHSTYDLDAYHNRLLTSSVSANRVLGIASVIYWGTYYNKQKPSHGIACHRVQRFHEGNNRSHKAVRSIGIDTIANHVASAQELIENGKYGEALSEIMNIPWLSRAFGSKVLAFLNPKRVGVYDIHISRYVNKPELEMKSTGAMSVKAEQTFTRFCNYLIEQAEYLNASDTPKWSDWNKKQYKWRAVDVERAMFFLATNKKANYEQL